jgi:hypothetical protein
MPLPHANSAIASHMIGGTQRTNTFGTNAVAGQSHQSAVAGRRLDALDPSLQSDAKKPMGGGARAVFGVIRYRLAQSCMGLGSTYNIFKLLDFEFAGQCVFRNLSEAFLWQTRFK